MVGNRITDPGFSDSPDHGRSFRIVMLVIGGLLLVQLLALAIGVVRRKPMAQVSVASNTPVVENSVPPEVSSSARPQGPFLPRQLAAPPTTSPGMKSPDLGGIEVVDPIIPAAPVAEASSEPGQTRGPAFVGPAEDAGGKPGSVMPGVPPSGSGDLFQRLAVASKSKVLDDLILERLLVTGVELRDSSNMQGALQAFREVESALPEHPRVLSEIAATLGKMGLQDKSTGYWERVESLGVAGAGAYHEISEGVLHGGLLEVSSSSLPAVAETGREAASDPANQDKPMRIEKIEVKEETPAGEGQKVSLRVVIGADPSQKPVADDLLLNVYFYDRLPNGEIRSSTADTSYLYPTEPYDWQVDGTEVIIVNYSQPPFTESQKRELGERSFYGYAIELLYRNELLEKVAMPEEVGALRFEEAPESTGNAAQPVGPENALFPNSFPP